MSERTNIGTAPPLNPDEARALAAGTHGDPFAVLGPQGDGKKFWVTVLAPAAETVQAIIDGEAYELAATAGTGD